MSNEINLATHVIDLPPAGTATRGTETLLETAALKLVAVQLQAGEESGTHVAEDEVLIECRLGRVRVTMPSGDYELTDGQAIHLLPGVSHELRAISNSVVLFTNLVATRPCEPDDAAKDAVQEASEESFPASDPPSWTPVTSS